MSNTTTHSNSASAEGSQAGSEVSNVVKEGQRATEDLRKGVNNFFDNAIQPSAARDSSTTTTSHSTATTTSGAGVTDATGTQSGSGFSKDAESLGRAAKEAVFGHQHKEP